MSYQEIARKLVMDYFNDRGQDSPTSSREAAK